MKEQITETKNWWEEPEGVKDTGYRWNGHTVGWCGLCDCFYIACYNCNNSSCNGGGCDLCCGDKEPNNFSKEWSKNYKTITKNWSISHLTSSNPPII